MSLLLLLSEVGAFILTYFLAMLVIGVKLTSSNFDYGNEALQSFQVQ